MSLPHPTRVSRYKESDPYGGLQGFGEAVRDCGGLPTKEAHKPALEAGLEPAEGVGFEPTVGSGPGGTFSL